MEIFPAILILLTSLHLQQARSESRTGDSAVAQSYQPVKETNFFRKLMSGEQTISTFPRHLGFIPAPLTLGKHYLNKRTMEVQEKKERELESVLHNIISELDSEEANVFPIARRYKSVSGESSGEYIAPMSPPDIGSKRKYGNIFRGPFSRHSPSAPRPRRQRKYRVDPMMFWVGIGK